MGQQNSKLSKSDIEFIGKNSNFSKQEVSTIFEEFKKYDKDGNGSFDRKEFVSFFKNKLPNYPEDNLNKLFDAFDSDKSNTIDFKELTVALSIIGKGSAEDKLKILFDIYDKDKSGVLEKKEVDEMIVLMKNVGVSLGKSPGDIELFIVKLFEKIDKDKNNLITRDEFLIEGAKSPSLLTLLGI
ncbi:hypothetical protein RB653_000316 [Dictyostelium firmibasis]|uniref:EF-hand domain-containing protein n=1 Tax=Dictyostelium firmibasis TaxID=79012 RepID=A0AAN7U2N5_9MYCE